LARRREDRERLVATQLDHLAAELRDGAARTGRECGGQLRSRLVAVHLRVPRVPADIRDEERAKPAGVRWNAVVAGVDAGPLACRRHRRTEP
jgi:hypothetical protein